MQKERGAEIKENRTLRRKRFGKTTPENKVYYITMRSLGTYTCCTARYAVFVIFVEVLVEVE